jgi:hypothetical protein
MVKKTVGRPPVMSVKIMLTLADLISHNYSIVDACKYARVGRSTYYHYFNNNSVFAEEMRLAQENQNKVSFNFRTYA